jgi:secreted trypsin-like serine protease
MAGAAVVSAVVALAGVTAAHAAGPGRTGGPRIVGGLPASISQYPSTVALVTSSGFQFCGGSLLSPTVVATAAHCVAGRSPDSLRVVAGRTDLTQPGGVVAAVAQISVYPGYTSPEYGRDAALLRLGRALPYPTIAPAQPSDRALYAPGTLATVLGWGRVDEGGPASINQLRVAQVPLVSDAECESAYPGLYDPNAMVCAGYPRGGVDSCQGDSGGPLIAGGKLIGLVSWGEGCARPGKPGVYTRVASYLTTTGGHSAPVAGAGHRPLHPLH